MGLLPPADSSKDTPIPRGRALGYTGWLRPDCVSPRGLREGDKDYGKEQPLGLECPGWGGGLRVLEGAWEEYSMHSELGILEESFGQLFEHDVGLLGSWHGLVLGAGDRLTKGSWTRAERAGESYNCRLRDRGQESERGLRTEPAQVYDDGHRESSY